MSKKIRRLGAAFLGAAILSFGTLSESRAEGFELFPNTDLVGKDYRTEKGTSLESCQRICTEEITCTGFTFNEKARWCFLKDGNYDPVKTKGAVSGRKLASESGDMDGLLNNVLSETASSSDQIGSTTVFPESFADDPLQIVTPFHFGMELDQAKEHCAKSDALEQANGDLNLYCVPKGLALAGLAPTAFIDFENGPDAKKRLTRIILLMAENNEYFMPDGVRDKLISGFVNSPVQRKIIDQFDEVYGKGVPPGAKSVDSLMAVEEGMVANEGCRANAGEDAALLEECDARFPVPFDTAQSATWTWRNGLVELGMDCGIIALPGRTGGSCQLNGGKMTMYLTFDLATGAAEGRAVLAQMSEAGSGYWQKRAAEQPLQDVMTGLRADDVSADLPNQEYTRFRGISIGMYRDQLAADLPQEFVLKDSRIARASEKGTCGSIGTDADGRVSRLELRQCFFNADGMSLEKFAQSIVDAYEISELNSQAKNLGNLAYACYVGLSRKNERIEICNYPDEVMIGLTKVTSYRYIGMTIKPPSGGSGPSFE